MKFRIGNLITVITLITKSLFTITIYNYKITNKVISWVTIMINSLHFYCCQDLLLIRFSIELVIKWLTTRINLEFVIPYAKSRIPQEEDGLDMSLTLTLTLNYELQTNITYIILSFLYDALYNRNVRSSIFAIIVINCHNHNYSNYISKLCIKLCISSNLKQSI